MEIFIFQSYQALSIPKHWLNLYYSLLQRIGHMLNTNLLRRLPNAKRKSSANIQTIYTRLCQISTKLRQRRLQFAENCYRAKDEIISGILLWHPPGIVRSRELNYPDILARDKCAVMNRNVWGRVAKSALVTSLSKGCIFKLHNNDNH